jgi:hypothetical protein
MAAARNGADEIGETFLAAFKKIAQKKPRSK